jgi:hypothetical protein
MRRPQVLILIGFSVFMFLAISALVARSLSATGTERSYVLEVAQAQARGDANAVLAKTPSCAVEPACKTTTEAFVAKLKRPGAVQILRYDPSINLPLTTATGTGRLAWRAGTGFPVVQCVRVRREGPLSGAQVQLLSISAPIARDGSCPS